MAGLLDMAYGPDDTSQGPRPLTLQQRAFAAQPGGVGRYEAEQAAQRQRAVYDAVMANQGSHQQAMGAALDPAHFNTYSDPTAPRAPEVQQSVNAMTGESTPYAVNRPAGGRLNISGIPIGQAAPQGAPQPGALAGGNTLTQGMPGSITETLARIEAAKAAGGDPLAALSPVDRGMAQAVYDGRLSLKDVETGRGKGPRTMVERALTTAHPDWNSNDNEAQNTYRKQFMSEKNTDIGGQVASINKLAGHANAVADAAGDMHSTGLGGLTGPAHAINTAANTAFGTPAAALERKSDEYNTELSRYMSGVGAGGVAEREQRRTSFNKGTTPQEMGASLLSNIEFLEKQVEGKEQHRNDVFKNNPQLAASFNVISPEGRAQLEQAKAKAYRLMGKEPPGAAPQAAAAASEIRVDAQGNRWTRDASGKVVPAP
jgi:hypothetical protein